MLDKAQESQIEDNDPLILVYRASGPKQDRGICYVKRSELVNNKNLYPLKSSAQALHFDINKILDHTSTNFPPRAHVEQKIRQHLMPGEIRRQINNQKITLASLEDLKNDITSIDDPAAQYLLTLITDQLKAEGLWRDEDKDLTMSEAFPLDQTKIDARLKATDILALKYGTYLDETTLTHEDQSSPIAKADGRRHAAIMRGPELSEPMLNNLMRASPRDLYHQIARRMIDTHYFADNPEHMALYPACYFTSKGVQDENHFNVLMKAGLDKKFDHYTFQQYSIDKNTLRKLLRNFLELFFLGYPAVVRSLAQAIEPGKRDPKTIWARFNAVWEGLTAKQREALEVVYMNAEPMTYAEASKAFGISLDSLKSRIKTAVIKFKIEFSEFEGITPPKLARKKLTGATTHNGLWRYESAAIRQPLTKIDPKTGIRLTDAEFKKMPTKKRLDPKTIAHIKAKIIENCPIPYIHDMEYFDGIKPSILSRSCPE